MYNKKAVECYEEGRVLHKNGNLSAAARAYNKAININRDFVEAHNNLGNVYLDRGLIKDASDAFRNALKIHPGHSMLLNNLGNALQLQGENEQAISWLKQAIAQDSNYADAHCNLGNALRDLDDFEAAVASYKRAIQINSNFAEAYQNLGSILVELDELDDAAINFNKSINIDPGRKGAYKGLGNVLAAQGKLDKAITAYRKAIEIDRGNKDAYNGLGQALSDHGELDGAIVSYQKAIEIDPTDKFTYIGLGNALSDHGETEKAVAEFRKVIELYPEHTEAYRFLSHNKKFSEIDDDIHSMESLYATEDVSDEQKTHLAFGLGKAYEDLGESEKSMEYILHANRLKRESFEFSISEEQDLFCQIKEVFSLEFFAERKGMGSPDQTPIFILGMPRSGTSLVEQILASHPEITGAGELNDLMDLTRKICTANPSRKYPECIIDLDSAVFGDSGTEYIARIRNHSESTKYITDKMPNNFLRIGFIRAILPNARIIHCARDPMDNCLSIFKNYFWKGHPYSYDLTEIGQYYNLYSDMMAYWRRTLPGYIYDLSYENLVIDQDSEIRKLISYCSLPWDDSCLVFHNTRRKVKTISNTQVRRPIYKDSVKLWKKYEKQLQPLARVLHQSGPESDNK